MDGGGVRDTVFLVIHVFYIILIIMMANSNKMTLGAGSALYKLCMNYKPLKSKTFKHIKGSYAAYNSNIITYIYHKKKDRKKNNSR